MGGSTSQVNVKFQDAEPPIHVLSMSAKYHYNHDQWHQSLNFQLLYSSRILLNAHSSDKAWQTNKEMDL